jgi:ABC-type lipoprotein release transport system permease subunit
VTALLYGVRPSDPVQLAVPMVTLAAAAALLTSLPARRATPLDPMVTLRQE